MRIDCPGCHFSAEVDAAKIPPAGTKAKCPRCAEVFSVPSLVSLDLPPCPEKVICPKCGAEQDEAVSCGLCGIIFEKCRATDVRQQTETELIAPTNMKSSRSPFARQVKRTAVILGAVVVLLLLSGMLAAKKPALFETKPVVAGGVLNAPSEYVAKNKANTASDDLFVFARDRVRIFVLYRVEDGTDVSAYGRLLDIVEPYRRSEIKISPYSVGSYSGAASRFLTYATNLPDWDIHAWLSLREYQQLTAMLKPYGLDIGECRDLPYVALLDTKGGVVGQWQGINNISKLHSAMKTLGFSAESTNTPSRGDAFVSKTAPLYQVPPPVGKVESETVRKYFEQSGLDEQLMPLGGSSRVYPLTAEMQKQPWFVKDTATGADNCGNFYELEVTTPNMKHKYLYCIVNTEAKLIASHSDYLEQEAPEDSALDAKQKK